MIIKLKQDTRMLNAKVKNTIWTKTNIRKSMLIVPKGTSVKYEKTETPKGFSHKVIYSCDMGEYFAIVETDTEGNTILQIPE